MVYVNKQLSEEFKKKEESGAPSWWRSIYEHKLILSVTIAIGIGAVWVPASDWLTIKTAKPAMLQLAKDAGMSKEGELMFLRTNPQLVDDSQMESVCSATATNANGFIEQGCYIPSSNQTYLRQMPSDLYDLEVSTAAYEMLHPAYIQIHNSQQSSVLDQAIEDNFSAINDSNLNSQVANFDKVEPGAKDLELFSLLGTGYSNLSDNLAGYYSPYFDNIGLVVAANNNVDQLFQNDQTQMTQLQSTIAKDDTLASTAYKYSVEWADQGNQYEDDYNYNIYSKDLDAENAAIGQYNQILDDYNNLVTEYDGQQPVSQLPTVQSQTQ